LNIQVGKRADFFPHKNRPLDRGDIRVVQYIVVILLVYYNILILSIFLDSCLRFDIMGSKSSADVTSTGASAKNTLSIIWRGYFL